VRKTTFPSTPAVPLRGGGSSGQAGQTLIMFAITMTFVFLALIALVGDADTLMVRYNQVDSEALLGAQTGATDVDVGALYAAPPQGPKYQLAGNASSVCESIHLVGGDSTTHTIHCVPNGSNAVTATVSWQVTLPIPLFMTTATVSATRTGQAVFGGRQAVTAP
jgi:hypothetical protein